MKIAAIILFLIVGILLFIAYKKQWLNKNTFEALVASATVLAALAAIFVFIIPAAQPTPENKNEEAPKTSSQYLNSNQSLKPSPLPIDNTNSNTSSQRSIPHNLITANTNTDN